MKKIEFASGDKVRHFQSEVDELILEIAAFMVYPGEDVADWATYVFVSDESRSGDFLSSANELKMLEDRLGLPALQRSDFVREVAEMLHQMRNPN